MLLSCLKNKFNFFYKSEENSALSVDLILEKTEEGVDLRKYYEKQKKFLPEHRKLLIKLVVDHLATFKKRVSNNKIGDLAWQISVVFPTEQKVSLYNSITIS